MRIRAASSGSVIRKLIKLISASSKPFDSSFINLPNQSYDICRNVNEINLMTAVRNCGQKDTMELVTVELGVNSTQMPHQRPFQIQEGEGVYFHFHWKVN